MSESSHFDLTRSQLRHIMALPTTGQRLTSLFPEKLVVALGTQDDVILNRARQLDLQERLPKLREGSLLLSELEPHVRVEHHPEGVVLNGPSLEQVEELWDAHLADRGYDLPTFTGTPDGTFVQPDLPTKYEHSARAKARSSLLLDDCAVVWADVHNERAVFRSLIMDARALVQGLGLSDSGIREVQSECGSLVQHVLHASSCTATFLELDGSDLSVLKSLRQLWTRTATRDLDCVLAKVLHRFQAVRDKYVRGILDFGSFEIDIKGYWLFVTPDDLGAMSYRDIRNQLMVLGALRTVDRSLTDVFQPRTSFLQDVVDLRAIAPGSILADRLKKASVEHSSLPKEGFVVRIGADLLRAGLPYFSKGGKVAWGWNAVKRSGASKSKRAREIGQQWRDCGGHFVHPRLLSNSVLLAPMQRRALRGVLAAFTYSTPTWRREERTYWSEEERFWVKKFGGPLDRLSGVFVPLLGPRRERETAEAWVHELGLRTAARSTSGERRRLCETLLWLHRVIGLEWEWDEGDSSVRASLATLQSRARSWRRWERTKLRLYLPIDFNARLRRIVADGWIEPKRVVQPRWSGEKIDRARRRVGMYQYELANALGVTESMVSQLISGKKVASEELCSRLDHIFNASHGVAA